MANMEIYQKFFKDFPEFLDLDTLKEESEIEPIKRIFAQGILDFLNSDSTSSFIPVIDFSNFVYFMHVNDMLNYNRHSADKLRVHKNESIYSDLINQDNSKNRIHIFNQGYGIFTKELCVNNEFLSKDIQTEKFKDLTHRIFEEQTGEGVENSLSVKQANRLSSYWRTNVMYVSEDAVYRGLLSPIF